MSAVTITPADIRAERRGRGRWSIDKTPLLQDDALAADVRGGIAAEGGLSRASVPGVREQARTLPEGDRASGDGGPVFSLRMTPRAGGFRRPLSTSRRPRRPRPAADGPALPLPSRQGHAPLLCAEGPAPP